MSTISPQVEQDRPGPVYTIECAADATAPQVEGALMTAMQGRLEGKVMSCAQYYSLC